MLMLSLTLAACGSGSGQQKIPGTPVPGFELVFADEFNTGSAPDPAVWNIQTGYGENGSGWGNNEWQLYTDDPENLRVEDGNLVIQARCPTKPCGVRDGTITSARINTQDKFEFKYGRVEARIKPPVGEAAWPAFWALGANFPPWPRSGEIDFMEMFQGVSNESTTHSTMHWCDQTIQAPAACTFPDGWMFRTGNLDLGFSLGDDFQIWEAEWSPEQIIFKINGLTYFTLPINPATMEEFLREFFLILNVAMGGTLGSNNQPPSGNEVFPQTMLVDYIRVYQREDQEDDNGGIIGDPPSLTAVSIASDNADSSLATTGDVVTLTFTADEDLLPPTVTIGGIAAESVVGLGTDWQASRTLTADDADGIVPFLIEYLDLQSNPGEPGTTTTDGSSVALDTTAPALAIENAPDSFVTLEPIPVTFQFSEPVTGFELSDIEVSNGAAGNFAGDGATYTADVTPNGTDSLIIGVDAGAATDAVGNPSEAATDVTVAGGLNPDAPLLTTISMASSNANPGFAGAGDVVTITLIASEAVTEPAVTISGAAADLVSGSLTTWTAERTALATDSEGEIPFVIDDFQSLDGTPGFRSTVTTDGSVVIFDVTSPTLAIEGLPPGTIDFLEAIEVTFQFSEDVAGFDVGDVQVSNGTVSAFAEVDAATYTADIAPDGAGDLTIAVADAVATDLAGNGNVGASETRTVDAQAWRLIWSDDFDGTELNAANWTARTDADCPDPCEGVQSYLTERVSVADGVLTIQARNEGGANFTSGLIDTRGKLERRFGRVEIDARMPGTLGTLPSLWLLPASETYGPWPQSGEIDVVNAPNLLPGNFTLEHTLRYGLPVPEDTATTRALDAPTDPTLSFIQYAIEWEGGEIRWFVNDVHVATQVQDNWYAFFEDADGVFTLGEDAAPFDEAFYLLIGLPVSNSAGGASSFPQLLEIEAVRVYECANPADPALGNGCSTGTGVPPEDAPGVPYSESLEVYTDAPAVLDFVDPLGQTTASALVPDTSSSGAGVTVTSTIDAVDGSNTVWNVNIDALAGTGGVFMRADDFQAGRGFFDLSGGETAGELLFRMRVNSATGGTQLTVGLDSAAGSGRDVVDAVADGVWRNYSVKVVDIVQGASVNLADIANLFVLEATNGAVDLDLDDIEVRITCRDEGDCQATARAPGDAPATVEYEQDFEALSQADPAALANDGFVFFADVWMGEVGSGEFQYQYGPGPAPNGGEGFSAVAGGEGGPEQGTQYLNIYSDYANQDHGNGLTINTSVLQELRDLRNRLTAADIPSCWTFTFDYKSPFANGIANPASNATANVFFVTLDPDAGFISTNDIRFDTTGASNTDWASGSISIDLSDTQLIGQLLQVGFNTTATNFEDSGVFYDNLELTSRPGGCPP
jgi:beta-glucanase (GH16 family)